jgi:phosphate-selective porin OprO/OprP
MFNDWGYKLQYDFTGSGKGGIKDAFMTYNGFEHVQLKAGNFKDPFMLQEQTSSKYVTFTERSLLDTFSSGRHIGLLASTKHQHWTASVGFFGDSVSTTTSGKDEGWSISSRLTYAPINEKTRLIHLGIASDYRDIGDVGKVRFKQQAETHISGTYIVDTGKIYSADSVLKLGAELAVIEGSFSLQSEYIWTKVERNGAANLDFDGWYAEAAFFLTGESRNYKKGKFGGISPKGIVGRGGIGAWQIAARYSSVDLNDHDVEGGQADSFTLGINWFPTSTLRFSGNYVNVLDVDGGVYHGQEPSLFQVRGQWAF